VKQDRLALARQRPPFMEALGLLPPYTVADVKKAYHDKARQVHPDAGGNADEFKALNAAYQRALDHAGFQESRRGWLGDRVERYAQRLHLAAAIEGAGGSCELERADSYLYEYGDDFADVMRQLVAVRMTGPAVTDASLDWLRRASPILSEVRLLDLSRSRATDEGVQLIVALHGLRGVDLRGTQVSAAGIGGLQALPELEWIHVGSTRVGLLARRRLQRENPRLTIATRPNDAAPSPDAATYEHERLLRKLSELGMLP
jgi:hypothetical protein